MEIKQIYLFGRNGRILKQFDQAPDFPLIEIDSDFSAMAQFSFETDEELTFGRLDYKLSEAYKKWGRFGYLGDVIAVKIIKSGNISCCALDFIGRLAIIKPGLAVDLVPIIEIRDKKYFVGIKRRYEPGRGLPAFMGGFVDVKGYHLDTPVETVLHEAKEEIGLEINILHRPQAESLLPPDKVPIMIEYDRGYYNGLLVLAGVIPTGDCEKMPSTSLKRVYQTIVYALLLDMSESGLSDESDIRAWLRPGDDAADLFIAVIGDGEEIEFGLDHHKKAWGMIMGKLKVG